MLQLPSQGLTQRYCARHLQTTPPKPLTGKETPTRSRRKGDVCGVECECGLDEDDVTSWEWEGNSTEQSKWERLAAVVVSGASSRKRPTGRRLQSCETQGNAPGLRQAFGFRGAGGERIRNHGQRKFKVRMPGGLVSGSTCQVPDVKRPLVSVAKMAAAGNRVHLDNKDPEWKGVRHRSLGQKRRNQQEAGFCTGRRECRSLRHR